MVCCSGVVNDMGGLTDHEREGNEEEVEMKKRVRVQVRFGLVFLEVMMDRTGMEWSGHRASKAVKAHEQ